MLPVLRSVSMCFVLLDSLSIVCSGGDVLERGAPVWSGVYGTGSSLQLQLLSQQQMLRQQELLMIQQHTAQVLELQRSAQLAVSLSLLPSAAPLNVAGRAWNLCPRSFQERFKVGEQRPELGDKADKRHPEPKARPASMSSPSPVHHPRKPPPRSRSPTPSTSSLTPLPPLPSPVAALKSEERVSSHPPSPLPHPPSPRSASPPPSSPWRPKQEAAAAEERREQRRGSKPSSFHGLYSGEASTALCSNIVADVVGNLL